VKPSDKSEIDILCIYCPETDSCYYVRPSNHRQSVSLRVLPAKSGQVTKILSAEVFRSFPEPKEIMACAVANCLTHKSWRPARRRAGSRHFVRLSL
jgi:hypothetical protein